MSDIGRRVRALREAREWNQSDLARRAGVSNSYINRLESGQHHRPSQAQLAKVAEALGVSASELLGQPASASEDEARELEFLRRNADVRMLFASFAREYETLHPDDQKFLRGFLELVAKRRAERLEKRS